ncbi:ABC transporter ATP-binding protein [Microbispora rosea]|uniref:ABC transporter ATP-binding protein n=1 Tax=Microbispora rosea TaxID=58117 RepID=UPI003D8CA968
MNHLSKSYGGFQAVNDISFEVEAGTVFALLGRNGAGKTTTMELLTGFQKPDAGSVRVLGLDPFKDRARVRGNVGIMVQEAGFFPDLTAGQTVGIWRDFTPAARPASEALELAGLTAKAKTKVRQLSGGEKRRLDLALALLGEPDVLFLDELTTGMDPEAQPRYASSSGADVRATCPGGLPRKLPREYPATIGAGLPTVTHDCLRSLKGFARNPGEGLFGLIKECPRPGTPRIYGALTCGFLGPSRC